MQGKPPPSKRIVKSKPKRKMPPIRMGDYTDQVRKKKAQTQARHKTEARVRTRIYQDILALLDIANRLTLDFSAMEDRYGLEWYALARHVNVHYKADAVSVIPGLQALIMSKEGAHGLPQGLYRQLLDFVEECVEFLKWARSPSGENPAEEGPDSPFMQACQRFKKACSDMQLQICIFENERPKGEESFFG